MKLDAVDAQELEDLVERSAFKTFYERIRQMLEAEGRRLETTEDAGHMFRAQGACQRLRAVLELPNRMIHEAKSGGTTDAMQGEEPTTDKDYPQPQ